MQLEPKLEQEDEEDEAVVCTTDLADSATGMMNCCGQRLHSECQAQWVASCRQRRAANSEQDDLSLLVPETPCCVFCCAKYGSSTLARSSTWG